MKFFNFSAGFLLLILTTGIIAGFVTGDKPFTLKPHLALARLIIKSATSEVKPDNRSFIQITEDNLKQVDIEGNLPKTTDPRLASCSKIYHDKELSESKVKSLIEKLKQGVKFGDKTQLQTFLGIEPNCSDRWIGSNGHTIRIENGQDGLNIGIY